MEVSSHFKDSTLRTHGNKNPKPLVCPKPAVEIKRRSQSKVFADHANRLRSSDKKVALPVLTGFDLNMLLGMLKACEKSLSMTRHALSQLVKTLIL